MKLKKILLVDDSPPFNFLSKTILKQNNVECQVIEALNGQSALDYLIEDKEWPEVILLDLNMPVMDGFQFLEELEKLDSQGRAPKVFVLTSSSRDEDRVKSTACRFVAGYFDKPLAADHIRDILSKVQEN